MCTSRAVGRDTNLIINRAGTIKLEYDAKKQERRVDQLERVCGANRSHDRFD